MQRLNRNNITRFSRNAVNIDIPRTRFNMPHKHTTTFNSGKLIPMFFQECLPGDTFQMDTSVIARMSTPEFPVMDTAFLDYYYFFVPNRLVWDNWKEFMGENPNGAWTTNKVERRVPVYNTDVPAKSNGDYFGLPTRLGRYREVSALPFRGLRLIWNEWFRSTALQDPLLVNTGDTEPAYTVGPSNDDLLPVCRFPDYFSTCLPAPQYGEAVQIGLMEDIPVITGDAHDNFGGAMSFTTENPIPAGGLHRHVGIASNVDGTFLASGTATVDGTSDSTRFSQRNVDGFPTTLLTPNNLWVDRGGSVVTSVNDLRLAFQVQRYQEALARGGSRYVEIIQSLFNVQSPDARLQRPEYLGGSRALINMGQVIQTSESASTPQGNVSGFSKTVAKSNDFTYSCVEHGMIIGVMTIRPVHSYQQGIDKYWTKRDTLDFYVPTLANIGEQPVLKQEIYAYGSVSDDTDVFGYQEAWADYRYRRSFVSGDMRSNSPNGSLDAWHYADDYASTPTLSDEWIEESPNLIDRTLAVQSDLSDQFIVDIYFNLIATRPLPAYSIPGLIDHH